MPNSVQLYGNLGGFDKDVSADTSLVDNFVVIKDVLNHVVTACRVNRVSGAARTRGAENEDDTVIRLVHLVDNLMENVEVSIVERLEPADVDPILHYLPAFASNALMTSWLAALPSKRPLMMG